MEILLAASMATAHGRTCLITDTAFQFTTPLACRLEFVDNSWNTSSLHSAAAAEEEDIIAHLMILDMQELE